MKEAVNLWRTKLEFLLVEELKASDAAQKFKLRQDIAEARAKIRELDSESAAIALGDSIPFRADISRIIKYAPAELIGREGETQILVDAWDKAVRGEKKRPHILTFVALGGEGKTSLVAKWVADLAHQGWPGCDAVFAWSFYSQGTREQMAASSDLFLKEALTFFGDPAMAGSAAGAFDKGRRLAHLVGERRAMLILDGVEPLQYPPAPPMDGRLKDDGIAELLKGLGAANHGLCVVTTRYSIPDLRAYWQTTAPQIELKRLSKEAGVSLLKLLGVTRGSKEDFEKLVEDVDGHALTLQILGQFLARAYQGDVRRRDRVKFEKADAKIQGGHAFRAMAAYVKWLQDEGDEARREVAILQLLGLFDRPATADCIEAVIAPPVISGMTDALVGLAQEDWEFSLTALKDAKLLTLNREPAGPLLSLDAHPLLREYFSQHLRTQHMKAWRASHRRLFEHLCRTTSDKKPNPTLEDLQPLYQAVAHGCQAGLQERARANVYRDRILRGSEQYSFHRLGAFGSDLAAIACFFETPWSLISTGLTEPAQSWLLNQAGFTLRALGRLTEALEPMRAGRGKHERQGNLKNAAIGSGNLSELELTMGEVNAAVADAVRSVTNADRSGEWAQRMTKRTTHADALHQAGRRNEAKVRFHEAEQMQAESQPNYPLLYSIQGFQYCDLLLAEAEPAAWRKTQKLGVRSQESELLDACQAVADRGAQTLKIAVRNQWLLDIALDRLTLGRVALYQAILERCAAFTGLQRSDHHGASEENAHRSGLKAALQSAATQVDAAVDGLRRASTQHMIPLALLTRAWLRNLADKRTGPESAQSDIEEAWEIAERGPMRLHMADIHLYRARLFHGVKPYPWTSPQEDLADARKLIEQCGYWRRKEELEDAEEAAKNW